MHIIVMVCISYSTSERGSLVNQGHPDTKHQGLYFKISSTVAFCMRVGADFSSHMPSEVLDGSGQFCLKL
jgi:hypothetical protein